MRKYPASNLQFAYIGLSCYGFGGLGFFGYLLFFHQFGIRYDTPRNGFVSITNLLFIFLSAVCLVASVRPFFDDPLLGKFSFDQTSVTFYTPLRTITFHYDECVEIGFTRWGINYIYFSKKYLTLKQRSRLFAGRSKKKRGRLNMPLYQSEYIMFQYRPKVFDEFIHCVPAQFREKLLQQKAISQRNGSF